MKVLSMWQPWASLVALGVKTIETRSWSTKYRGPLTIHAGARAGDEWVVLGDWTYHGSRSGPRLLRHGPHGRPWEWPERLALPLGAIVATCTLVDVGPIGGPYSFRTGSFEGDEGDFPGRPVVVRHPPLDDWLPERLMLDHGTVTDITDQLPYGDFTPDTGRYAWLLADIVPVDPPVPFKGGQGLSRTWEP